MMLILVGHVNVPDVLHAVVKEMHTCFLLLYIPYQTS